MLCFGFVLFGGVNFYFGFFGFLFVFFFWSPLLIFGTVAFFVFFGVLVSCLCVGCGFDGGGFCVVLWHCAYMWVCFVVLVFFFFFLLFLGWWCL